MKTLFRTVALCLLAISLTSCKIKYRHQVEKPGTSANYKYGAGGYIRYDGYRDVAGDMEVAVSDFAKKGSKVTVQLVGVVHIADKDYYKKLEKEVLSKADVVLFEAVRAKGRPMKFKNKGGGMYAPMASLLGLSEQMQVVDYTQKNFKHCDITIDPSKKSGAIAGVKQLQKAFKIMKKIEPLKKKLSAFIPMKKMEDFIKHTQATGMASNKMDMKNMGKQIEPLLRLAEKYQRQYPDNPFVQKLVMQLRKMKKNFEAMGKMILETRNTYVINMLTKEIKKGEAMKKPYTISIFYGAAHNSDLAKRMAKLGYTRSGMKWYKAWKINSK